MKMCMIGTGYVGLVSGTCFADLGNKVYCVDKNKKKIDKLNQGISPIYEPGLNEIIKKNFSAGRLNFTTNISKAIKNLGWRPNWNIVQVLHKTIEWHNAWKSGNNMHLECLKQIKEFNDS